MRRLELTEHAVKLVEVTDVNLFELEPVGFCHRREVLQIAGVGELVDHADCVRGVIDDVPRHCRLDESGIAGDEDAVHK